MTFGEVAIGGHFFEEGTGEYFKKKDANTAVVINVDTGEEYYECVFPKDIQVEQPE